MNKKLFLTTSITLGAGVLLALAVPIAASAHVEVTPNTAAVGSYADLTFRVPSESATAMTTKVEVDIPTATPFSHVSYVAVPGWGAELVTATLPKPVTIGTTKLTEAVTKVIWTAQPGSEITEHEIRQFTLSVGTVPDTGKIELNAIQTYSDGSIARWTGSGKNAEHPSPVLYVKDTPVSDHETNAVHTPVAATTPAEAPSSSAGSRSSSDTLARVLGIGGLAVGAAGVVLSLVTLRRRVTG